MPDKNKLIDFKALDHINADDFEKIALDVFRYQYAYNDVYSSFVDALKVNPALVTDLAAIPFLPVSFFKTHKVVTGCNYADAPLIFESSGTTGETPARHYVCDAGVYEAALMQGFEQFYDQPAEYAILALLPSYLERKNASLVHMAQTLMNKGNHPANGFYLDDTAGLHNTIQKLEQEGQKTLLLGVTFALLDFAAVYPMPLHHTIVMETGGMKGRKEEQTRAQVHESLKAQWQLDNIHSEYGMTELLSQAYAASSGIFKPTSTMRVFVRDINDPLDVRLQGLGCLNIIDLANINSCAFIATDDIGNIAPDGSFEVLGRADHTALRGCSLMTA